LFVERIRKYAARFNCIFLLPQCSLNPSASMATFEL
jgi:hypothetical protein